MSLYQNKYIHHYPRPHLPKNNPSKQSETPIKSIKKRGDWHTLLWIEPFYFPSFIFLRVKDSIV